MPTFKLTQSEIIGILDELHPDAYDKLQGALEHKVCQLIAEKKWLEIWESGDWCIEMMLKFSPLEELQDEKV